MNETTISLIIVLGVGVGIFILCREFFCWYFKITEVSKLAKQFKASDSYTLIIEIPYGFDEELAEVSK
jgi:hypothetical protein